MLFFSPALALFYGTDAISEATPFRVTLELPDKWLRRDIFTLFHQNYLTLTMSAIFEAVECILIPFRWRESEQNYPPVFYFKGPRHCRKRRTGEGCREYLSRPTVELQKRLPFDWRLILIPSKNQKIKPNHHVVFDLCNDDE